MYIYLRWKSSYLVIKHNFIPWHFLPNVYLYACVAGGEEYTKKSTFIYAHLKWFMKCFKHFLLFFQSLDSCLKSIWCRKELLKATFNIVVSSRLLRNALWRVKRWQVKGGGKQTDGRQMSWSGRRTEWMLTHFPSLLDPRKQQPSAPWCSFLCKQGQSSTSSVGKRPVIQRTLFEEMNKECSSYPESSCSGSRGPRLFWIHRSKIFFSPIGLIHRCNEI